MEQYFPVISRASSLKKGHEEKGKKRSDAKYKPYRLRNEVDTDQDKLEKIKHGGSRPATSAMTKFLLDTLSDESNPITHSDIGQRSDRVISTATGHQVGDVQRDRRSYFEDRKHKLSVQWAANSESIQPQVMSGVRVYIDGYLENTTDIEMKKIIIRAGGQVVATASGCTHILTSQPLSGSKTHKLLTTKSRNKIRVVKPQWVLDSIEAGRRRAEREYTIRMDMTTKLLHDMFSR